MEGLVDLLPLLFIGLYYWLAARRKAKVRQAAQRRVEAPQDELIQDEPRTATPFQTFLDQLEEAMQEANGSAPEPPPEPVVELPERPRGPALPTAVALGGLVSYGITRLLQAVGAYPSDAELLERQRSQLIAQGLEPEAVAQAMQMGEMFQGVGGALINLVVAALIGAIGGAIAASIFKKGPVDELDAI